MLNTIHRIFIFSIFLIGSCFSAYAQDEAMMSLAGDSSTKFHSLFRISDGTFLIGGESISLNWLPSGVVATTLTLPGTTNSASTKVAFILHVSPDLKTIVRAVRFPAGTVQNVFKIKTNAVPGQPTGDLFISGARDNELTTSGQFGGYYLAKLNGNFLNSALPTGLVFIYDVACRGNGSNNSLANELLGGINQYKAIQPWDVQSDGRIVFGLGHAYSPDWAGVNRLRANGKLIDTVQYWPRQNVRIRSGNAAVNIRNFELKSTEGLQVGDSIFYQNNSLGFAGNVAIDSILSSELVFKGSRGGSNLRSSKTDDFNLVSVGKNGTSVRVGKFPEDFIYPSACLRGDCPNAGPNPNTLYGTTFNNFVNTTHKLGDITIDRRNNDMYLAYAILGTHPRSKLFSSDVEPVAVAMQVNGKLKRWNRLHQESKDEGSPAAQELDGLALDYSSNQLFVAGSSFDTCRYNFWKGNAITLKPGGNGFQNQFTGQNSSIKTAWLGKMNLSDGKMKAATYVGEYANNIG